MKIFKTGDPNKRKIKIKEIIEKIGKRNLAIAGAVLVIGFAVYLNWFLFKDISSSAPPAEDAGSQNVQAQNDSFFTSSLINRNRARDEAMEVLQTVLDSGASNEASQAAMADIARIASEIEKEANIEELVKSKGFKDCVAVISGESINIIVKCDSEALLPNQIAQIKEIAYTGADILPENVVIIEK
ncbi:MAG: SpoIIIAH-like family protein [Clostridia bacterium]|nr:SpoIIIAH-like family protein [Clostridia bacterium]